MSRQITVKRYGRRFRKPLRTAHGEWALREGFLLRVDTEAGIGYGEVAPIPEFGSEPIEAADAFLSRLVRDPGLEVPSDLPCCAFALSAALMQLLEGRPFSFAEATADMRCRSGNADTKRTTQRSSLPQNDYHIGALLPAGSAAQRLALDKIDLGYRNLKWKIGVEPLAKELVTGRGLLETLPAGVTLRFDANASLNQDDLEGWLELLAEFPEQIDYLEQPLLCGEEAIMADYMQSYGVPIALDESLNAAGGERFLELGAWAGPLVIKAPLLGDIAKLRGMLQPVAEQVVLSSVFETGIGLENALALADSLPELQRPIGYDTVDAFDDTLNHIEAAPTICAAERAGYDPEQIWNSLES